MRWPKLIQAGSVLDQFALNIDLAPTLLEIAGAPAAKDVDGRSLVPLLRGGNLPWRKSFVIEHFSDKVFPRVLQMGYHAVRTDRWKYIRYRELDGMDELYDLRSDPFEMRNVIAAPHARTALSELQAELTRLLDTQ
jgi:N-acetylglucosamine-6-sulfatase